MINNYISNKSYAIVSGYINNEVVTEMGVTSKIDRTVVIHFPKGTFFSPGQKISVYIDNRTGVDEFDSNLNIYRVAVKGTVVHCQNDYIVADILFYELFYGTAIVERFSKEGYSHPKDHREAITLPETPLVMADIRDNLIIDNNKVGVFVTTAPEVPHSSIMAYLATKGDDVFIISHKGSFKSDNIEKNRDCTFTIDHRGEFSFEMAVFWNFTVLKGLIYRISGNNPVFSFLQAAFVDKNPWEKIFFTHDNIEMFHIQAQEVICPQKENYRPRELITA